jgi:hypothetical protein
MSKKNTPPWRICDIGRVMIELIVWSGGMEETAPDGTAAASPTWYTDFGGPMIVDTHS